METMSELQQGLREVKANGDFLLGEILEVICLRLKRLEEHLGIPMPEDFTMARRFL